MTAPSVPGGYIGTGGGEKGGDPGAQAFIPETRTINKVKNTKKRPKRTSCFCFLWVLMPYTFPNEQSKVDFAQISDYTIVSVHNLLLAIIASDRISPNLLIFY